jgi:hypothetical protein
MDIVGLFGSGSSQAYIECALMACEVAVGAGITARGAVDRDALRRALRSLLIGLRVRH